MPKFLNSMKSIAVFLCLLTINKAVCNEILPEKGFKVVKNKTMPQFWRSQYNKLATYRLIKDISFKPGIPVLEINNPEQAEKPASIRTTNFLCPAKGKLIASIWAKGRGNMKIYFLPSNWKGNSWKKIFPLGKSWRQYKFEIDITSHPADKKYFFRIDCFGKGLIHLASPSLKHIDSSSKVKHVSIQRYPGIIGKNLTINPGFEFGWTGWHPRFFSPSEVNKALASLNAKLSYIKTNAGIKNTSALYMPAYNIIESVPVPIKPGQTYTLSANIKTDKAAQVKMFVIDYKWRIKKFKFTAGPEWERHSFTFKWNQKCYFNEVYIRFDAPNDCGMYLDNIQFEKGTLTNYEAPKIALGIISPNNVLYKNSTSNITLRAIPSSKLTDKYTITMSLRNSEDKVVDSKKFTPDNTKVFCKKLNLPTKKYGLYRISLKAHDSKGNIIGSGYGRYAVIKKLKPDFQKYYTMGVNYYPYRISLECYKKELPVWIRLGVGNALCGYTSINKAVDSNELNAAIKKCIKYFQDNGCKTYMRTNMPKDIAKKALFGNYPAGNELWEKYVEKLIKTYSGVVKAFAFMGEINIYRMLERWRKKYGIGKFPLNGTNLMPPDKGFKYFRSASLAAKKTNPAIEVIGPSLNGEDFAYIKSFMKQGAEKYMDIFGMDPYRASPDTPEAFTDYLKLKKILKNNGFNGPAINLEQYLGICVKGQLGNSERSRNYYTPWNQEAHYAGVITRNYIQHAATNIVWMNFMPEMSLYTPYLLDGGFPSMAAPATAAATYFLNRAGTGIKITKTDDLKAFLFPNAHEAPLLTVYIPLDKVKGILKIQNVKNAYDMMGNEFSAKQISSGIPISSRPVYLKFAPGTSIDKIRKLFDNANIIGIGPAFGLNIIAYGNKKLAIDITNKTNKKLNGTIKLSLIPKNWSCKNNNKKFKGLASGEKRRVFFEFNKMPINSLAKYPVSATASSGNCFSGQKQVISPIFAYHCQNKHIPEQSINISAKSNLVYAKETADKNLKANIKCNWDLKGFYLKLKINDNDFRPPQATESNMYLADSIQVYFDQLKNAHTGYSVYNNDDVVYQIGLLKGIPTAYLEQGPEGRYLGSANTVKGIDKDVKVKISHRNNITQYDIFFPWHTLRFVKPEAGEVFGFSVFVHDRDKNNITGISFDKTTPYKNPFVWKDMILK